jgi:hypothetical protein
MASCAGWLLRDPLPRFLERHSGIASVTYGSAVAEGGYLLTPHA